MTTITAKVILDSISSHGIRLPSVQCRYPKVIHGEVMTHRVFSRNASSSRAIPVERLIQDVIDDPYVPAHWGRNQRGMQAYEELQGAERQAAIDEWMFALEDAVKRARNLASIGAAKQIVNRIIEPYCHINTLITSTEWANFFALRCHPMAQPEMRMLAEAIRDALAASTPKLLGQGGWHLPYFDVSREVDMLPTRSEWDDTPWDEWFTGLAQKVSVARCARLSYMTHDGRRPDVLEDLALYDRLVGDDRTRRASGQEMAQA